MESNGSSRSSSMRVGLLKTEDGLEFSTGCGLLLATAKGMEGLVLKTLTEEPRFATFVDYDARTALHVAASEGRLSLVKLFIEHGAKVNATDRWGGTPLDDAMRHGHAQVAEHLRGQGGKLGIASVGDSLQVITAASVGNVEDVTQLLADGVPVDGKDYDGRTAVHLAAVNGHIEALHVLIKAGADINCVDRWGNTPLDEAEQKKHTAIIAMLKSLGGESRKAPAMQEGSSAVPPPDDSVHKGTLLSQDALIVDWAELSLLDKIGAGAFGDIYKARWRGTMVAAKVLKKKMDEEERKAALHDLKLECLLLRQLRHPNICMLLGICLTTDREVMVSELMKCSLADVFKTLGLQESMLKKAQALKYAIHFAQGMNYLHLCKPPILHRDLKPANLLIDFSDNLKVADFGLAKLRPLPKRDSVASAPLMTGETGSYRFMAPEVFRHEPYNEKVDVYSFALVLYNMFIGHAPWADLNGVEAARVAALEQSRPSIPRHWDMRVHTLLSSAWAPDALLRPSFTDILQTLEELSENLSSLKSGKAGAKKCVIS